MGKVLKLFIVFAAIIGALVGFVIFYPYIFAKTIVGEITAVERVATPLALIPQSPQAAPNPQIFSFAVAIREESTGEIFTASSEDRQWAAVNPGFCAHTKIFPYPPWKLDKAGTYYGARLLKLFDCKK